MTLPSGTVLAAAVLAVAENYPQLRADGGFGQLQRELADVKDRFAFARNFAAHRMARYHELLDSFPSVLVAQLQRRPHVLRGNHDLTRVVGQRQLRWWWRLVVSPVVAVGRSPL